MDSDIDFSDDYDVDESQEMNESSFGNINMPTFQSLTPEEIVELMNEYIEYIESVVQMPATTTRILLSHTKWDKQELLEKLTNGNSDELFARAHVLNPFTTKPKTKGSLRKKLTCSICFCEFTRREIVDLGCGHEYCKDCWCQYLTIKINDDGHAESICCPAPMCGIVVDDVTVMKLVADENTRQKYQHLMTNSFVEYNHNLRWCPSPGCTLAIKANDLLDYRQNCACRCGKTFCFNCGDDTHDPISCTLIKGWRKNGNDSTVQYLTKFTKGCPKCHSLIEKNGGCNHMTCRKCNHEFCWICFSDWKKHVNCNTYKSTDTNRNDEQKWEHYFKRYGSHKKSMEMEKNLVGSVQEKMQCLQNMGSSWNGAQFLKKAVDILCESRKQLMFTYIFAYYTKEHNQKQIFEINQSDLESATEELSRYLEQELNADNADDIKRNVMNKSNYCERRQFIMQEHIFEGFEKNWWQLPTTL